MASSRAPLTARRPQRPSTQENTGRKLQGVDKEEPRRLRSSRARKSLQPEKSFDLDHSTREENHPNPQWTRKRPREVEYPENHSPTKRLRKRLEISRLYPEQTAGREVGGDSASISHWIEQKRWPKEYFEEDMMQRLIAKKKSVASLHRKRSGSSIADSSTPSDLQAEKSAPYKNPSYETVLEREAGSYMDRYEPGITEESERLCQTLLDTKQPTPKDSIFRDDVFEDTCQRLRGKNEARIFRDCTPLIVPFAEPYATLSVTRDFDIAIDSVNEGWNNSKPITKPRPQPDYALGFRRSAFSEDQLKKLQPFLGDPSCYSYFMGTYYMHFPFFTCEVKCGSAGLDIADRQNLHSMTLAVRGIVELFRLVHRAEELHRTVLAFSISHDQETVRIYGHFPVIDGAKTTFRRYTLRKYNFTERKGFEKWTSHTFTTNIHKLFMPIIFAKICSAIDDLPLQIPPESEQQISEHSGLSQKLDLQDLSEAGLQDDQLQQITPNTSIHTEKVHKKKKR